MAAPFGPPDDWKTPPLFCEAIKHWNDGTATDADLDILATHFPGTMMGAHAAFRLAIRRELYPAIERARDDFAAFVRAVQSVNVLSPHRPTWRERVSAWINRFRS